jgi:hypothetical protein
MEAARAVPAICQRWIESEAGWGVRPDGWSLHQSLEHLDTFVREYWKRMPDKAPAEYSRPHGKPFTVLVNLDVAAAIEEQPYGIWWGEWKGQQWDNPLESSR